MQEQQGLYCRGSALDVLSRGHWFVTGSRSVLQQGQETPTAPPEQPHQAYPREVAEGEGDGVTGGHGEEEDEGACEGAGPAPSGLQELPVREC